MSGKLRKLNKPFNRDVMTDARRIAEKYEVILVSEGGTWFGKGLEMPHVFGEGKTPDECVENTRKALIAAVAHMIEQGEIVPAPSSEGKRSAQVNIRLTQEEKIILSASARAKGFQGLADFIRARALST
jgi:predicted RNase H-like HicB family nuclease